MPLELGITLGALVFYVMRTKTAEGSNRRIWILGGILLALQVYNWAAPEPETLDAMMPISGLAAFTVVAALAWWAGKGRKHVAE